MNKQQTREAFEQELRRRSVPFVCIDETKRAMFSATIRRTPDYCVYHPSDNWLVLCAGTRWPSPAERNDLDEWGKVFGDGFTAIIVREESDGLIVYPLHGAERIPLDVALDAEPEPDPLPSYTPVSAAPLAIGPQLELFGGVPCATQS